MKSRKVVDLRLVKLKRSCEQELTQDEHEALHARAYGWPWALCKALADQWTYMCKLATGEVISFAYARLINQNWVRLYGEPGESGDSYYHEAIEGMGAPCPRGVDVNVGAIVWVADAPHGS